MRMNACSALAANLAGEEKAIVALTLALAETFAPIIPSDFADSFGRGNEPVHVTVDVTIGFQSFRAGAHAIERDQHHWQMIGETIGEFRAPASRPGHGALGGWGKGRVRPRLGRMARRQGRHELLQPHPR
jgi:hypothetical protein